MNSYEIDNVITTRAVFTDSLAAPVDPAEVFVIVTDPNGAVVTYDYGVDIELERDDTGKYHISLLRSIAGDWTDRWKCAGNLFASKSQCFTITDGCSA